MKVQTNLGCVIGFDGLNSISKTEARSYAHTGRKIRAVLLSLVSS